jgi:radical SAM superfamily enzyme YgiQ (UPF0313 family)
VKIALLQLPLQSHDYVYSRENIPLAAGYLAAYLAAKGEGVEVCICPGHVMNLGGDAALLRWVVETEPDIVGFSCYLWNVERTLHLCGQIRQRLERCTIMLGGPEVTPDNAFLLGHGSFHCGVCGEGEETFFDLVSCVAHGGDGLAGIPGLMARHDGATGAFRPRGHRERLDDIPSPYLKGLIGPSLHGTMLLETMRGCPMRCAYCYYHKSAPKVRAFPVERIRREVAWARGENVKEITLIDPCFARRPDLEGLLAAVAAERSETLGFSCELNAEDLTPTLVRSMVQAGLCHVEVGLQSINPVALRTVGRRFDEERFISGLRLLRDAGVKVMTDVMVGLPGDRLADVKRAIDFVLDQDLCDELGVYPLSVLPGTVLRAQARRFGIEYLPEPPYLITKSSTMNRDDIREAFAYAEETSGTDLFPVELPRMGDHQRQGKPGFISRIVLCSAGGCRTVDPHSLGEALCLEVRHEAWMQDNDLASRLRGLLVVNPYSLLSWVVPEGMFRPGETARWIRSVSSRTGHSMDREYMSSFTPERSCQLFVESMTAQGLMIYTMLPLDGDRSRTLWASLPADADPGEEDLHGMRLETLLGYKPLVRYYDRPEAPVDALDRHLGAVMLAP